MKNEIRADDVPEWDGKKSTAIQWFANVQEVASHGGYIPWQLGQHLWLRFKEGSPIKLWYYALDPQWKEWMRRNYLNFLSVVREYYLGDRWQQARMTEYALQQFRQPGHLRESPLDFVLRRILYARMLLHVPLGGNEEVREVMANAPVQWRNILSLESVENIVQLQLRIGDLEDQLLEAARTASQSVLTLENLPQALKGMGWEIRRRPDAAAASCPRYHVSANIAEDPEDEPAYADEEREAEAERDEDARPSAVLAEDPVVAEVYATATKRQRPPPKGGYPYAKRDDVKSVVRLPPSPCKCCGSANHWDRECPWFSVWQARFGRNKTANVVERSGDQHFDTLYNSAFDSLNANYGFSSYLPASVTKEAFVSTRTLEELELAGPLPPDEFDERRSSRRAYVEEVADEEELLLNEQPLRYVIEKVGEEESGELREYEGVRHRDAGTWGGFGQPAEAILKKQEELRIPAEASLVEATPKTVKAIPRRVRPSGESAIGVSVVSVRGRVASLDEAEIDLRLDSGADISLISEELYESLRCPPRLKQGTRMRLWQLTEKGTSLKGYVVTPIFIPAKDGTIIEAVVEAYVVPGMTVPILLGEDFQLAYEMTVARNVEFGTTVSFGSVPHPVAAQGVRCSGDFGRLRQSTVAVASFVRAKWRRRERNARARKRKALLRDSRTIRAASEVLIPPHSCKKVAVEGQLGENREWLVEKSMLGTELQPAFVVPNTLISSEQPYIPVTNPSSVPRYVRKGEILGELVDPQEYLDAPRTPERLALLSEAADRTRTLIGIQRELTGEAQPDYPLENAPKRAFAVSSEGVAHRGSWKSNTFVPKASASTEDENWGPKTAEVPTLEDIPSSDLETVLDVGDVPEQLKARAMAMLRKHIGAFGFDGRLGKLATKCRIRTKDDVQPIAVPMYGSSPAKRQVIDEQLRKWFVQDVIEPSESPWSAPVVIVYRNGKARFCVDYRKLNAVTIPDEFPIPRQSEILAALSGAQVLSSLDALSGFTQIEIDERDVEKTAFRTHQGLFQFKRMPFGLRNGPSIFQRTMQSILSPFLWLFTLVYIDDIVVYSRSYEEHLDHLDKVLAAIEKSGLTLSPDKCHFFYSSVLLLGHKVSRLGLSTHEEKVRAILELQRPKNVSELQTFLGMVVYFSSFIPFYASIAAPLFQLLRKGAKWTWGADQERAFEAAKKALQSAPVLGHPVEGRPYRLYTDASDEALGCCLQQVQPIRVGDLKGTKTYDRLAKAYREGEDVPRLTIKLSSKTDDSGEPQRWGTDLDSTTVLVERVVAYWSRTFKDAEKRYSATEREALAAKEGLIKFQPYIEGEKIILVTDHAALQWARTYENANRRLAAWGAVYSAYAPGLEIIHRPGRVHSNVDPLSRMPRAPPAHTSPAPDRTTPIALDGVEAATLEQLAASAPAKRATALLISSWREVFAAEPRRSSRPHKPSQRLREGDGGARVTLKPVQPKPVQPTERTDSPRSQPKQQVQETTRSEEPESDSAPLDPYHARQEWEEANQPPSWEEANQPPTLHVSMDSEWAERFVSGYQTDASFRDRWKEVEGSPSSWDAVRRFFRDEQGLLFFKDADFHARLCVPRSEQARVLREGHESPYISAHAGPEKLWELLSARFYWPRMKKDILAFCATCDVCQKTKPSNFQRFGRLSPNPIPSRPYESVSLDLIVNLPWSNDFNAVLVVVDRFTKHAQFIPTTTGLNARGFAMLFVKHVACRFGLPASVISDRDPRWTSEFWKEVARILRTDMLLSSSHHPQHDGQTEIVNRQLETMLRAYVAEDRASWEEWLPLLEHAYNSRQHSSTGSSQYFLLYGFEPRSPLDATIEAVPAVPRKKDLREFMDAMYMHRESARRAIARAQVKQAESYNRGRRPLTFEAGDLVLVNPHTLEWAESKGEGAKLVQRWIGPFEVQQRINNNTYRIRLPDNYPGNSVINLQHLKKYQTSPAEFGVRTTLPDTRVLNSPSEEYEVERIVGHRYDRKSRATQYLVRWVGHSPLHDQWVSARDLRNAPDILFDYQRRNRVDA